MIVVDIETSGQDPRKNSIVSIGALDFCNPKNQFYIECKIWDGAEITAEALKVNGFTEEQIKDPIKPDLKEAMIKFLEWTNTCKYKIIAGENPSFDRDFLRASAERCGLEWNFNHRIVDLHAISYSDHLKKGLSIPIKDNKSALSLHETLLYVGLQGQPKPHNGLTDAKLEAEALSRIIFGKPLLEEFKEYSIPSYLQQSH